MTPILAAVVAPAHRSPDDWRARAICTRHIDPDALFASAPEQRRALLKRRPDVRSWRALLDAAREEFGAAPGAGGAR